MCFIWYYLCRWWLRVFPLFSRLTRLRPRHRGQLNSLVDPGSRIQLYRNKSDNTSDALQKNIEIFNTINRCKPDLAPVHFSVYHVPSYIDITGSRTPVHTRPHRLRVNKKSLMIKVKKTGLKIRYKVTFSTTEGMTSRLLGLTENLLKSRHASTWQQNESDLLSSKRKENPH